MRILKLAIDGYGRFAQFNIDLAPGLQLVYGPNEQGKTTLRAFIGDMLYGQKRSAMQRLFEEANELRCPWLNPDAYGGRIVYALDDMREIEVYRRFDRKNEMVHIYDKTHAAEITNSFELLKNREPQFAMAQLGLSKDVFLNTATISHFSLDDLGDNEALSQIRERILALADTGEERTCADVTLRRLKARIDEIGQPTARTRPLPKARARLAELDKELEATIALRAKLEESEQRRMIVRADIDAIKAGKLAIEADLSANERIASAEQLREAEKIAAYIDVATQRCFTLSGARDFPMEITPEVHHANTRLASARDQVERAASERLRLESQIAVESAELGVASTSAAMDIPEEYDQKLAEIDMEIELLRRQIGNARRDREAANNRLIMAEREFAEVPDFSRLADDPVTWINQLSNSFRIAVNCRDDSCKKRSDLREQVVEMRESMSELEELFSSCPDFADLARDYEVSGRMREEQAAAMRDMMEQLYDASEEYGERIAAFGRFTLGSFSFLVGLLVVAFATGNSGVLVPTAAVALSTFVFACMMFHARAKTNAADNMLEQKQADIQELWASDEEQRRLIDQMIVDGGCQTLRELYGKYDQYRDSCGKLASLVYELEKQERISADAEFRVAQLFDHLRDVFYSMNEIVEEECDIEDAALHANGVYQVYRDSKRRMLENREQIKKIDAEEALATEDLEEVLAEERSIALEVRRLMRENGYPEESRHDSALMALRSYRIRHAEYLKKRGRVDALRESLLDFDRRVEEDRKEIVKFEESLKRLLATGKCDNVQQWDDRDRQAREYQTARDRVSLLQEQLRTIIRNTDLNTLRATVAAAPPPAEPPKASPEELKRELLRLNEELDARMREEHAIHLELTERAAGARSICEIEEERTLALERVELLEFEVEAASHAMTLIEEIARDKHARIAPRLAERAGNYLKEITGGLYDEVLISRDLSISIRVPQTSMMTENPEKVLSKGAVDQIYLALRLAMVQSMSENAESIPLLLDDPFANYDDRRLERALTLLLKLSTNNQVILFTCREDVVRVAQTIGAPILRLDGPLLGQGEEPNAKSSPVA